MNEAELDAFVARASVGLDTADGDCLRALVDMLRFVTSELEKSRVSVRRLKNALFGPTSERSDKGRLQNLQGQLNGDHPDAATAKSGVDTDGTPPADKETPENTGVPDPSKPQVGQGGGERKARGGGNPKGKGHGRLAAERYTGAEHNNVAHPTLKHKGPCPKCQKGRVYRQKLPKSVVRLAGHAIVSAKVWNLEHFRCSSCDAAQTAPLPPEAGPPDKYDESATSAIALAHYGYGMPFTRLEYFQRNVGVPLPASTQWDLVSRPIDLLCVIFTELVRDAAKGGVIYTDDTTGRILDLIAENKDRRRELKRTGMFTTGALADVGAHKIAVYFTGRQHAGENLSKILAHCEPRDTPLIHMSDGLDRNAAKDLPPGLAIIMCECLTHGRRKYVDVAEVFPEHVLHVIEQLKIVYRNEAHTKESGMSDGQRLRYHQKHSGPIMGRLRKWLRGLIRDRVIEPNSQFGKAVKYMTKRWKGLTTFLRVAGAPIDNNPVERALKRAIRYRRNSLFYKTLKGARVGDIYMSLIHTCELNGVNAFEYLTELLRQGPMEPEVARQWLPWNHPTRGAPTPS